MLINNHITLILKLGCVASRREKVSLLVSMSTDEDIGASNSISIWIEDVRVAWPTNEREEILLIDGELCCDVKLFE